ncbi:uncharacterized protein LOC127279904 [Leptopilina boulardi]|uniref:uncharacterized protein LOC127279904 n=1 Tax=Leptopilina boulardi TaxID=63433 RepID=UPI0021F6372C|nr:uncharacterized protein LOC127279904 [Leptopilina boulardi]XP_051158521.1 uncharacterized protein LOC127279904 [Leptopilina boulardi]
MPKEHLEEPATSSGRCIKTPANLLTTDDDDDPPKKISKQSASVKQQLDQLKALAKKIKLNDSQSHKSTSIKDLKKPAEPLNTQVKPGKSESSTSKANKDRYLFPPSTLKTVKSKKGDTQPTKTVLGCGSPQSVPCNKRPPAASPDDISVIDELANCLKSSDKVPVLCNFRFFRFLIKERKISFRQMDFQIWN